MLILSIVNIYPPAKPTPETTQPPPVEGPKIPGTPIVETSTPIQEAEKKESLVKYVFYFFLGLILPVLGLIVGGNWIIFKEKQKKRWKLAFLLLGFILSMIILFIVFDGPKYIRIYYT